MHHDKFATIAAGDLCSVFGGRDNSQKNRGSSGQKLLSDVAAGARKLGSDIAAGAERVGKRIQMTAADLNGVAKRGPAGASYSNSGWIEDPSKMPKDAKIYMG